MKAFDILFVFSVSSHFSISSQQMIGFGTCPDFNGKMKDFDVAQVSIYKISPLCTLARWTLRI